MSLNRLGPRKTRAIARSTGLSVTRVVVASHVDSGRHATFYTDDGRRGAIDRHTGRWSLDPDPTDTVHSPVDGEPTEGNTESP